MRHQWITIYVWSSGIARWVQPSVLACGVACVSMFGQGCGQSADSQSSKPVNLIADEALRAIEECQAQGQDCFANTVRIVCEEQLRACLLSFLPDAGTPPPGRERDAAAPPGSERDAGRPPRPDHDAGPPDDDHGRDGGPPAPRDASPPSDRPPPDAGSRNLPDAAKGALTDPVGNDAGPAVHACVNALRACLATGARPSTCAEESRACLSHRDGG